MLPSRTISLAIPRNWLDLYETIWKPEFFPKWASGLSHAPLVAEGNGWKAKGPEGPVKIRFTGHNALGVMDHYIDNGFGKEVYVPMRVIANQEGAEVVITVFRQPLMSDEKFAHDVAWVTRDLQALYALMTS
ncbi:polyketide cyclase [Pantoea sp. B65]|uniref:polyketide cyclase n=1 Tax=Pantoea sp. B65 TaxID=2813359 RepID=UPI0039B6897B